MEITTDQLQVQSSGDQPLQIQSANQQLQIQSANQLQIHPNAIVMKDANLQRKIKIGLGTVVHPKARLTLGIISFKGLFIHLKASIDAGRGAIEFGSYNIVEEGALIQNKYIHRNSI
jgi:UDP-3-O-[3-hydroxymyristoyl] glucosamine N-acyltransferase